MPESSYPTITLYGGETLRTLRVHWALSELSLNYEAVSEFPRSQYTKSPDYRTINSTGQIPALKIGEMVITESAAICLYLFERFSDESTISRHALFQWCFYAMTELDSHTLYIKSPLAENDLLDIWEYSYNKWGADQATEYL